VTTVTVAGGPDSLPGPFSSLLQAVASRTKAISETRMGNSFRIMPSIINGLVADAVNGA
jgi:hypothetical protein